ncbi:MAG: hypothetical protein AAF802_25880 [Planctomycetota bacterium]
MWRFLTLADYCHPLRISMGEIGQLSGDLLGTEWSVRDACSGHSESNHS